MAVLNEKPRILFWQLESLYPERFATQEKFFAQSEQYELAALRCGSGNLPEAVRDAGADLVVFINGIELTDHNITIEGLDALEGVPRVACCHHDLHSPARYAFLQWCHRHRIDAVFAITKGGQSDGANFFGQHIYSIPRSINEDIFRDYGEAKTVALAMLGCGFMTSWRYPWRREIFKRLGAQYPVALSPRPRSGELSLDPVPYARMLNRSFVAFACGGLHGTPTKKLLEIPASRACLVCPPMPILSAYGFEDRVHCVMVEAEDAKEVLDDLFEHPEELARITDAGFEYVHSGAFAQSRMYACIAEWYRLRRDHPDGRIVQTGLLEPMRLAESEGDANMAFPASPVQDRLREALALIHDGDFATAARIVEEYLKVIDYIPEASFGLGLIHLFQGRATEAYRAFLMNIGFYARSGYYEIQDPVVWGYYLTAAMAKGELGEAFQNDANVAGIQHPFLEAARFSLHTLAGKKPPAAWSNARNLPSFLPEHCDTAEDWLAHLLDVLRRCGASDRADVIEQAAK